jgi:hypothetical protein
MHTNSLTESQQTRVRVDSGFGEDWGVLVRHAALAVASATGQNALGAFELDLDDAPVKLTLSAVLSQRNGRSSIDTLTMRARCTDGLTGLAIADAALEQFGGTDYTSVSAWASDSGRRAEPFEATVYFASRFPFLATNVVLPPSIALLEHVDAFCEILGDLGVRYRRDRSTFAAKGRQLRLPMRPVAQLAAYEAALDHGLGAALYTAALPVTQSMRIEQGVDFRSNAVYVDCALSRGLSGGRGCTTADAAQLQVFAMRYLGIDAAPHRWLVRAAGGRPLPPRRTRSAATVLRGPAPRPAVAAQRTAPEPRRPARPRTRVVGHLRVIQGGRA